MTSRSAIRSATGTCSHLHLPCQDCRRRTGSAFCIAGFYPSETIRVEGESHRLARSSADGFDHELHFCPNCGATVYWMTTRKPGQVAVAAGAFAAPAYPPPGRCAHEQRRHSRVRIAL
ncbi:MAG: GFA family protein [Gammaproteobacteria bacterium]|nr:GFA family protein [Gammaproteobacteria bacterium]